jgi:hypothetical protein
MKTKYRIYIIGDVPQDLKDRIAAVHAAGIINEKNQKVSIRNTKKKGHNRGGVVGSNPSSLRSK